MKGTSVMVLLLHVVALMCSDVVPHSRIEQFSRVSFPGALVIHEKGGNSCLLSHPRTEMQGRLPKKRSSNPFGRAIVGILTIMHNSLTVS